MISVPRGAYSGPSYFFPSGAAYATSLGSRASRFVREAAPPAFRKRVGFQDIKQVPMRWMGGGAGGVHLYGNPHGLGGTRVPLIAYAVLALAIYGAWVLLKKYI